MIAMESNTRLHAEVIIGYATLDSISTLFYTSVVFIRDLDRHLYTTNLEYLTNSSQVQNVSSII